MIPLEEVRVEILGAIEVLEPVEVERGDALGLVLADDVVSSEPIPPFANTAMDGYAVRAASTGARAPKHRCGSAWSVSYLRGAPRASALATVRRSAS